MHRHSVGWVLLEISRGPVHHVAVDIADLQFGKRCAQGSFRILEIIHPQLGHDEELVARHFICRDNTLDSLANDCLICVYLCTVKQAVASLRDCLIEHLWMLRFVN